MSKILVTGATGYLSANSGNRFGMCMPKILKEKFMKKLTVFFASVALLLNVTAPTLTHATTQGQDVEQAAQNPHKKTVTVMSRGQIDSSKITTGWYAHIVYLSEEGTKRTATGQIMEKGTDHILIRVEDKALESWKTIAYRDMDTLVVAQHTRDIEEWRKARQTQQHPGQAIHPLLKGDSKIRVYAPVIRKGWMVGNLIKMTQDTLVVRGELTLYGRRFYQVPLSSISNFEVSVGQHRNTFKGMGIGLGISGLLIAVAFMSGGGDLGMGLLVSLQAAIPITTVATTIGLLMKSDKWVAVPLQRLNLSLTPTSTKGLRAVLTFNF